MYVAFSPREECSVARGADSLRPTPDVVPQQCYLRARCPVPWLFAISLDIRGRLFQGSLRCWTMRSLTLLSTWYIFTCSSGDGSISGKDGANRLLTDCVNYGLERRRKGLAWTYQWYLWGWPHDFLISERYAERGAAALWHSTPTSHVLTQFREVSQQRHFSELRNTKDV